MEDNPFVTQNYHQKLERDGLDPDRREDLDKDDGDDQGYSDGSDGSESSEEHVVIEDSVREDMAKLEQTFKGMGLKYRMIDRIGEGDASKLCQTKDRPDTDIAYLVQAHSQPSTRPKIYTTIIIRTTGTQDDGKLQNGYRLQPRRER